MSRKVDCAIQVDVEEIRLDEVTHLGVVQRMDGHHTFDFRVKLADATRDTFTGQARKYLGKKATVRINFAPQTADSKDFSFEGIVTDAGFSRAQGGYPELNISGMSVTFLLDAGNRNRSFTRKNLKQLVEEVCKDAKSAGLQVEVKPRNTAQLPFIVQYEESDHHFLSRLAVRYGEWFFFDGTKLLFGQPPAGDAEKLVFGQNLYSLDIGMGLRPNAFELKHWDHVKNELLSADSTSGSLALHDDEYGRSLKSPANDLFKPGPISMVGNVADKSDLDGRALAMKRGAAAHAVVARGTSDNARLRPGKVIKVTGPAGKDDSDASTDYGEFLVVSVSHSSSSGNYENHFEAIPAKSEMIPIGGNLRTPVSDPQVAVVKEVDDPDKLGRVRVQFLWQQGGPELSPWIRVLSSHANATGGAYVLPEVGDEVLVDFEFNDPEQPFVVGSLYTGQGKPDGAWVTAKNEIKAFRTKGGNEIVIIDRSGKESIQIRNKDGKNEVVMTLGSKPSILVKTSGKLTLDADTIEMRSNKLDVQTKSGSVVSDTDLKLEASDMAMKSKKLDVKTTAGGIASDTELKLEGSAMVTVKGGLVKLN